VQQLTPARALIADIVRRYWVLGDECTYLEVQKLAWFLERAIQALGMEDPFKNLDFSANIYGPYSDKLRHLLNGLDGTYLHCDKRLSDAGPTDTIWFDPERQRYVDLFLQQEENCVLKKALELAAEMIDGFESPLGMELLATVDWLIAREHCEPSVGGIRNGLKNWPAGTVAAERKLRLFDERLIGLALERLMSPLEFVLSG